MSKGQILFEIELPWPVTGNHSTKHTRTGAHYKTPAALAYRGAVRRLLAGAGVGCLKIKKPLLGPLAVDWVLTPPDKRGRDVDNARKETADALTLAGLWVDDSNKVIRRETFEWTEPEPGGKVLLTVRSFQ